MISGCAAWGERPELPTIAEGCHISGQIVRVKSCCLKLVHFDRVGAGWTGYDCAEFTHIRRNFHSIHLSQRKNQPVFNHSRSERLARFLLYWRSVRDQVCNNLKNSDKRKKRWFTFSVPTFPA
jgi:hypothetical protein